MTSRRLLSALFSALFAFQLLLAGQDGLCALLGGGPSDMRMAAPERAMAAMAMPAADAALMPDGSREPGGAPCDDPVAPTQCHSMAACMGNYVTVSAELVDADARHPSGVAATAVQMPRSPTSPPELPPPRA